MLKNIIFSNHFLNMCFKKFLYKKYIFIYFDIIFSIEIKKYKIFSIKNSINANFFNINNIFNFFIKCNKIKK